jgi:hypothetical protein
MKSKLYWIKSSNNFKIITYKNQVYIRFLYVLFRFLKNDVGVYLHKYIDKYRIE